MLWLLGGWLLVQVPLAGLVGRMMDLGQAGGDGR